MKRLIEEFNLNMDLAIEAHDLLRGATRQEIEGVKEEITKGEHIKTTTITILNEQGAKSLGRPIGSYITIESPPLKINDPYVKAEIIEAMEKAMQLLTAGILNPADSVLLVGLGNWRATADSLGPKFIEYSPITRHYHQHAPDALVEGMRPTSGIAPGVLGITGLETFEVIKGVVEKVNPALLIVVDSLAATNVERIGTTIQMSNTGIQPGAGLGNQRHALTFDGLGVPVIAVGCPTIVNAAVIADQAIRSFCSHAGTIYNDNKAMESIKEILSFFVGGLAVTPKEIDDIIENTSRIISLGIGKSLFPGISEEQLILYAT
ncbi:MAG TPA: GPR endopeptidase [Syntrophomonadaceae bacterium]|nr:GPR endopeptidase [Syntrophomonadaceae bacterium]HNX27796.1 GPR endopeptidase [Syntrophomonadaceae bacterium]HPR93588.1 GPR endopeptidase [Syntrophomonadaceae bacterium]